MIFYEWLMGESAEPPEITDICGGLTSRNSPERSDDFSIGNNIQPPTANQSSQPESSTFFWMFSGWFLSENEESANIGGEVASEKIWRQDSTVVFACSKTAEGFSNGDDIKPGATAQFSQSEISRSRNRLSDCVAGITLAFCCRGSPSEKTEALTRDTFGKAETLKYGMIVNGVCFDETDVPQNIRAKSITPSVFTTIRSVGGRLRRARTRFWTTNEVPDLTGLWICTATWGLDEFLMQMGISYLQRMAATRAPWPSWEFSQDGDDVTFINNGVFGALTESFIVDGPEFIVFDGWKQKLTCKAYWDASHLIIERQGPDGSFHEEREIDLDGTMHFTLTVVEGAFGKASWGRTFKREPKPKPQGFTEEIREETEG